MIMAKVEIIPKSINTEVNKSNVTAIVDDIVKKRMENQFGLIK